jgi:hypothetical protein
MGTPNHLFTLEFDLDKESVNTFSLAFEYRAYYFGYAIRVG